MRRSRTSVITDRPDARGRQVASARSGRVWSEQTGTASNAAAAEHAFRLTAPYKPVLAAPGARALFVVALLARLPVTGKSIVLTLHVVLDLHRSYAAAGLVGMLMMTGTGIGAPFIGRMIDRHGLKTALLVTGSAEIAYWMAAPFLTYPLLLATTLGCGLLGLPVFSVIRQAIAASVPEDKRRQAFALDSIVVEMAFMIGPALGVASVTSLHSATTAMFSIGLLIAAAAAMLWALNPPMGHGAVISKAPRAPLFRPAFLLLLAVCMAASLALAGTEISITATLKARNEVQWAGLCISMWCLAALVGGLWHGSTTRPRRLPVLMLLLGAGTVPVGFVGHFGWPWLCLMLLPAGFLCAPTLASTSAAVAEAVPASARGQATGLQSSAVTLGGAVGAPLAGAVIDRSSPPWGFAVTGAIGVALAAGMLAYQRWGGTRKPSVATSGVVG